MQVLNSPVSAGEPSPWADATDGASILIKAEILSNKRCAFKSNSLNQVMTEASMDSRPILTRITTNSGYEQYAILLPEPSLVSSKTLNILSSASVKLIFSRALIPTNSEIGIKCIFKQIMSYGEAL